MDGLSLPLAIHAHTQLFLVREELARNHEFERDDDAARAAAARRRELAAAEPEPTSAQLTAADLGVTRPTHIEEAGLKWRLIEDRRAAGGFGGVSSARGMCAF